MSLRQTAKMMGCSCTPVKKVLKEKGLLRSRDEALKLRSTDAYIDKISKSKLGIKNGSAKLDEDAVRMIREEYEKMKRNQSVLKTKTELAEHFGTKRQTINDILFGRTWTHVK